MATSVAACVCEQLTVSLFRRSGSSLSVPLSRMPAANRKHLWDRRVLSTRKRQGGRRCHGLHSKVG